MLSLWLIYWECSSFPAAQTLIFGTVSSGEKNHDLQYSRNEFTDVDSILSVTKKSMDGVSINLSDVTSPRLLPSDVSPQDVQGCQVYYLQSVIFPSTVTDTPNVKRSGVSPHFRFRRNALADV